MRIRTALIALSLMATTFTARADLLRWYAPLAPEATGATGTGTVDLYFNTSNNVLSFTANFSGLSGNTTVAHFHCCTSVAGAGTAGVAVDAPSLHVPTGVQSGTWTEALDLDDANNFGGAFLGQNGNSTTQAIAALLQGFDDGTAYLNIHSSQYPGGEIRGFPAAVSAPGTAALLVLSLAALRRRRN